MILVYLLFHRFVSHGAGGILLLTSPLCSACSGHMQSACSVLGLHPGFISGSGGGARTSIPRRNAIYQRHKSLICFFFLFRCFLQVIPAVVSLALSLGVFFFVSFFLFFFAILPFFLSCPGCVVAPARDFFSIMLRRGRFSFCERWGIGCEGLGVRAVCGCWCRAASSALCWFMSACVSLCVCTVCVCLIFFFYYLFIFTNSSTSIPILSSDSVCMLFLPGSRFGWLAF
ncbi:hypothetical protein EDC01DRAFT_437996 [Geopyxis carbonaria]|nr:hypothetical protein EDC01DRAFT_437996 [Geopyxis carbonaria]